MYLFGHPHYCPYTGWMPTIQAASQVAVNLAARSKFVLHVYSKTLSNLPGMFGTPRAPRRNTVHRDDDEDKDGGNDDDEDADGDNDDDDDDDVGHNDDDDDDDGDNKLPGRTPLDLHATMQEFLPINTQVCHGLMMPTQF